MPPPAPSERDQLKERSIPHMMLSDGSSESMTPAPEPPSAYKPETSAKARFAVNGNAIVTGGTGTLGIAASRALLEHGLAGLAIFDVNPTPSPELDRLRQDFPSQSICLFQVDVTDDTAVAAAVSEASSTLGPINHLLCFHGIVGCIPTLEMSAAHWRKIIDVNTTGTFLCAQAVARKMVEQKSAGSIIFVASISAHRVNFPQPQAAYNVSKAGLITLKNCLAAEWARYGIRVNTISPGYMDTILNEGEGLAETREMWNRKNPSGRMGVPSELTGAVVMLSSSSATYMNGTDIVIDGGSTMI